MSVEIAWKQNILVTDFHLLKSLSLDLVCRHLSVDSADKTLTVYSYHGDMQFCTAINFLLLRI